MAHIGHELEALAGMGQEWVGRYRPYFGRLRAKLGPLRPTSGRLRPKSLAVIGPNLAAPKPNPTGPPLTHMCHAFPQSWSGPQLVCKSGQDWSKLTKFRRETGRFGPGLAIPNLAELGRMQPKLCRFRAEAGRVRSTFCQISANVGPNLRSCTTVVPETLLDPCSAPPESSDLGWWRPGDCSRLRLAGVDDAGSSHGRPEICSAKFWPEHGRSRHGLGRPRCWRRSR